MEVRDQSSLAGSSKLWALLKDVYSAKGPLLLQAYIHFLRTQRRYLGNYAFLSTFFFTKHLIKGVLLADNELDKVAKTLISGSWYHGGWWWLC